MSFINESASTTLAAGRWRLGVDLRPHKAITDPKGRVLIYVQTGGMMNPAGYELSPGTILFRSGSAPAKAEDVEPAVRARTGIAAADQPRIAGLRIEQQYPLDAGESLHGVIYT